MIQTERIIEIRDQRHWRFILDHYHTVKSLQQWSGRSRAWAYRIMAELPTQEALDLRTGKRYRLVRKEAVRARMRTLRQPGNPNWR